MNQNSITHKENELSKWFDSFIDQLVATIRTHQLTLEKKTATPEVETFYDSLIGQNFNELMKQNRDAATRYFIPLVINEYLKTLLLEYNCNPQKIALDFDDSSVLVWAQISSDDAAAERALILSEAKVNAKFDEYGFFLSTTIVEREDNLEIPNHYKLIK